MMETKKVFRIKALLCIKAAVFLTCAASLEYNFATVGLLGSPLDLKLCFLNREGPLRLVWANVLDLVTFLPYISIIIPYSS